MNQRIRQLILLLDLLWIAAAFMLAYVLRYEYVEIGSEARTSFRGFLPVAVSYTHLTLPTICSV